MCAVHCDASQLSGQIEHTLQSNALPRFRTRTRPRRRWCFPPRFSPQSVTLGRHKGHILNNRTGLRFTGSLKGWIRTLVLGWSSLSVTSEGAVSHWLAVAVLCCSAWGSAIMAHCYSFILNCCTFPNMHHSDNYEVDYWQRWNLTCAFLSLASLMNIVCHLTMSRFWGQIFVCWQGAWFFWGKQEIKRAAMWGKNKDPYWDRTPGPLCCEVKKIYILISPVWE